MKITHVRVVGWEPDANGMKVRREQDISLDDFAELFVVRNLGPFPGAIVTTDAVERRLCELNKRIGLELETE